MKKPPLPQASNKKRSLCPRKHDPKPRRRRNDLGRLLSVVLLSQQHSLLLGSTAVVKMEVDLVG
jgi:hypothetical protein